MASVKVHKHRIYWPSGFHKVDRAGRPVFYDRVGQSDLSALRADPDGLDQDEMVRIFIQNMEVGDLRKKMRGAGRILHNALTQGVLVYDVKGERNRERNQARR